MSDYDRCPMPYQVRAALDRLCGEILGAVAVLTPAAREVWLQELQRALDEADRQAWVLASSAKPHTPSGADFCALCKHPQSVTRQFPWGLCCLTCAEERGL